MSRRVGLLGALAVTVSVGGCAVVGFPAPAPPAPTQAPPVQSDAGRPAATDGVNSGATTAADRPVFRAEPRSRSGNPSTYEVRGQVYSVAETAEGYDEEGYASWYGDAFAGRPTSSGEIFDPKLLTAAHRTLPLPTWVEVTNLTNQRSVVVRVNDRGPFADTERRIIDVSEAAARRIGLIGPGVARVRVRALRPDELSGSRLGAALSLLDGP